MKRITLVYDGQCPFCSRYSRYVRLRSKWNLELLDARLHEDMVRELLADGYDIDKGMILIVDSQVYHGSQAVVALMALSKDKFWYDILVRTVFRFRVFTNVIYPIILFVRQGTLKVLGREPTINKSKSDSNRRHRH